MVQGYNHNNQRIEAGRSEIQGYPWLHGEFETSLGCMRLSHRKIVSFISVAIITYPGKEEGGRHFRENRI